jgi:hypothetical protein
MQLRLTKENEWLFAKIGLTSSADINKRINDSLKQDGSTLYTQPQKENESILPLLLRLVEAQEHIAKNTGCVVPTHPVNESSEKDKPRYDALKAWQSIKLPKTSVQWIWIPTMTIEELYWWPEKPKERLLSEKQRQRVDDLCNKTIKGISSDWDRESSAWATRDLSLVYNSMKWPADLYDQYARLIQEWLLRDWEYKAHLFKF